MSSSGNYIYWINDLAMLTKLPTEYFIENKDEIVKELAKRPEIADVECNYDGYDLESFDVIFWLDYLKGE